MTDSTLQEVKTPDKDQPKEKVCVVVDLKEWQAKKEREALIKRILERK